MELIRAVLAHIEAPALFCWLVAAGALAAQLAGLQVGLNAGLHSEEIERRVEDAEGKLAGSPKHRESPLSGSRQ